MGGGGGETRVWGFFNFVCVQPAHQPLTCCLRGGGGGGGGAGRDGTGGRAWGWGATVSAWEVRAKRSRNMTLGVLIYFPGSRGEPGCRAAGPGGDGRSAGRALGWPAGGAVRGSSFLSAAPDVLAVCRCGAGGGGGAPRQVTAARARLRGKVGETGRALAAVRARAAAGAVRSLGGGFSWGEKSCPVCSAA